MVLISKSSDNQNVNIIDRQKMKPNMYHFINITHSRSYEHSQLTSCHCLQMPKVFQKGERLTTMNLQ